MSLSNATDTARDMLADGKLENVAEANVTIIQLMGVRIVDSPMPREVRKALQDAVKEGRIGRLPKKGELPEAFHHGNDNAKWKAMDLRERFAREKREARAKALAAVMVHHRDLASE